MGYNRHPQEIIQFDKGADIMLQQSKPVTAVDALRPPQKPKSVMRQGAVSPTYGSVGRGIGSSVGGGVQPMAGSPYPPAPEPRPMQPQRFSGVPSGTQVNMPAQQQPNVIRPATAFDALASGSVRPVGSGDPNIDYSQRGQLPNQSYQNDQINTAQKQAMIESKVATIQTMDQFNAAMTQASQLAMNGDPNAQMIIAALIKRFQSLQSIATPQPITPVQALSNQAQY